MPFSSVFGVTQRLGYRAAISAVIISSSGCSQDTAIPIADENAFKAESLDRTIPVDVWAEHQSFDDRLALLLPSGTIHADRMQMTAPRRWNEISNKLQKYAQEATLEFVGGVLRAKSGEPLAYDPKFGITKDEYEYYLKTPYQFQKIRDDIVTITVEGTIVRITLPQSNAKREQVDINVKNRSVITRFGEVSEPRNIAASKAQDTGPWNGFSWQSNWGSLLTGYEIRFYLGQFTETKKVLLHYEVRQAYGSNQIVDATYNLDAPVKRVSGASQ